MLRSYGLLGAAAFILTGAGSGGAEEAHRPAPWSVQQRCNVAGCQFQLDQCEAGCRTVGPNSFSGCITSCRTRFQSCVQATCRGR
jgi:hypothetical protein